LEYCDKNIASVTWDLRRRIIIWELLFSYSLKLRCDTRFQVRLLHEVHAVTFSKNTENACRNGALKKNIRSISRNIFKSLKMKLTILLKKKKDFKQNLFQLKNDHIHDTIELFF